MTPEQYRHLTEGGLFPLDKQLHLLTGFFIAAVVATVLFFFMPNVFIIMGLAIFATSVVGYVKERLDKKNKGVFDVRDLLVTILGGLLFIPIFFILTR